MIFCNYEISIQIKNDKYPLHIKNIVYFYQMSTKSIKFIELANKRVNKTIKDIQLIGNLAHKQNYDYTELQAKQIIKTLQQELDDIKHSFSNTRISSKKVFVLDKSE